MKKALNLIVLTLLIMGQSFAQKSNTYKILVGTYTQKTSEGVYYVTIDKNSLKSTIVSHSDKIDNPSFLDVSKDKKHIYAVCETDGGSVQALKFNQATGEFKHSNIVNSGGAHPCHIALDKTGKWIFTGNYTGGSLGVLPVMPNGTVGEPIQTIQHTGKGPNKDRQEKPHVHSVNISPDNKNLFVADLGIDEVVNYAFDAKMGRLKEVQRIKLTAGSGPRHFAFHPSLPYAYVIQELTGKVTLFSYKNGLLKTVEEVSTLPTDFTGNNSCADIHISPDGKFLYGSNRFYDTIVTFSVDPKTGKLSQLSQTPVGGKVPRNFGISPDGKYVFVANQNTDNIVIFERNAATGLLKNTGKEINISMPVCIKFL
ncbi:lactonase family protein [Lacihabitans sp. CCS-44]|uniref:lactonase family protein n=1 Tax=Lacihabitans sp. CCS-44 TaxID=2487331 RepID=UPI0020CEA5C5|nr:lactonase family protein [Lacihabitans sp. CCS-44]MCP9753948.1 lactonase family protein [Lacihabitans sp. CCS-44]